MEISLANASSTVAPDRTSSTSSKDLVRRSLCGTNNVRPVVGPLAVHYCAELAGVSLRDYTLNPRKLADCVLRYYEAFRPEANLRALIDTVRNTCCEAAVGQQRD